MICNLKHINLKLKKQNRLKLKHHYRLKIIIPTLKLMMDV